MKNVLAIILAGGQGQRLGVLTCERAKPAVPFAGKYRIIDFTLSNSANSGLRKIAVLTQYQPISLIEHIGTGKPWDLDRSDCVFRVIQAYLGAKGRGWYKGTADAVYQNFQFIEEQGSELVIILSGDHVGKMDYSQMLNFHYDAQADVTLAVKHFPEEELRQFGTVVVDEEGRVTGFEEKVKKPKSNLVSMGIYIFKRDILRQWLEDDAQCISSSHDFGRNIFPAMVGKVKMFAYNFEGYWRDVGSVSTYWQSNMEILKMPPDFLSEAGWPIRTKEEERAPAIIAHGAEVISSLVSQGCIIEGRVEHSVLSPGVKVSESAVVKDSVILSDSIIEARSVVDYSIVDKGVVVGAGSHIGYGDDFQANLKTPKLLNTGITVVGKGAEIPPGMRIGRNCVIYCHAKEEDFPDSEVKSGETIERR